MAQLQSLTTAESNTTPQTANGSTDSHKRVVGAESEWYELVDGSVVESLPKNEQKRQGLWWELIKAEKEYVRDLATMCEVSKAVATLASLRPLQSWATLHS